MFCKNCGTQLKDGAKFCGNCGAACESAETINKEATEEREESISKNNEKDMPKEENVKEENVKTDNNFLAKLISFFPINKKVSAQAGITVVKTIGIYLGIWFLAFVILVYISDLLIVGKIYYAIYKIFTYYCRIGIILAIIQLALKKDYSNIEYWNLKRVVSLFKGPHRQIMCIASGAIAVILVVYAIFGTINDAKRAKAAAERQAQYEQEMAKQEEEQRRKEEIKASISAEDKATIFDTVEGSWGNDELVFTFGGKDENAYFFSSQPAESWHANVGEYYVGFYEIADCKVDDNSIYALLEGGTEEYEITLSKTDGVYDVMSVKETYDDRVYTLNREKYESYDDVLTQGEIRLYTLTAREGSVTKDNSKLAVEALEVNTEGCWKGFYDVSDGHYNEELLVADHGELHIFGQDDEGIKHIYSTNILSLDRCYYDASSQIFYTYDSGAGDYVGIQYVDSLQEWSEVRKDEESLEAQLDMVFWESGDEEADAEKRKQIEEGALARVEQRAEQKAKEAEEAELAKYTTITYDESLVITEPLEEYIDVYYYFDDNYEIPIEICRIDEESIKVNSYTIDGGPGETIVSISFGERYDDESIPDGMVVYKCVGTVYTQLEENQETISFRIVLLPDGHVFLDKGRKPVPTGIYY